MYQHIMVESGAKVFQKNNRLCIEKDVFHELPAEDIATVVLDNREIILPRTAWSSFLREGRWLFSVMESICQNPSFFLMAPIHGG